MSKSKSVARRYDRICKQVEQGTTRAAVHPVGWEVCSVRTLYPFLNSRVFLPFLRTRKLILPTARIARIYFADLTSMWIARISFLPQLIRHIAFGSLFARN